MKTPVDFLHIGKTGGTALIDTLRGQKTEDYLIRMYGHKLKLVNIPEGHKVVFFIRHPVDRFISSYYSRQRKGAPRHNLPWRPPEAAAFGLFKTANQLAEALSSTDLVLQEKAQNAMRCIFHVRNSFFDHLQSDDYFNSRLNDILFIGNQIRLDEDLEKLKDILGLPAGLKLPRDDIRAHRNTLDVDKNLSEEGRKNIENWYQKDIVFYEKWQDGK